MGLRRNAGSATAITATTNVGPIEAKSGVLRLETTVSAISGASASLTVTVETSANGTSGWVALPAVGSAMPAITTVSSARRVYAGCDRFVRIVETVAGTTPSITRRHDIEFV